MREFSPQPTQELSPDAVEASANRTVSDRFRSLGKRAGRVAGMVTQRFALNAAALALLISSGCSNVETPVTPTAAERTPISAPITETVKTGEKPTLTEVKFVRNLLGTYLNLDADPELQKLKDQNYLDSALSKPTAFEENGIRYTIPSLNIGINVTRNRQGLVQIAFNIDKEGKIVSGGDPRLSQNEPLPARDEADELVLSATRNVAKFLRNEPNKWSVDPYANDWEMSAQRSMISDVVLPNGQNVRYTVGGTGEQPLSVWINIPTVK